MEIIRVSSGISSVDEQIQGGFPSGSVVAYLGKPGIGKTVAGLHFISTEIKDTTKSLIITTGSTVPQLKLLASKIDLDISSVLFVDAAIWRIKRVNPKVKNVSSINVSNLTDLNALLATIVQTCKETSQIKRILFDTPTSLLLYSTPGKEQVFKFFELLTAYTRSNDITMIYPIELGVHPSSVISTFLFLSDGAIYFRFNHQTQGVRQHKVSFMWLTQVLPKWIELVSNER